MCRPHRYSPRPVRGIPFAPEASVLAITVAWGLSFVVIPRALLDCGPVTLTALRMTVGTAAALLILRPRLRTANRASWRFGLLGGAFLTGGYLLQTVGMQTAGSGEGGFLTAFSVVLVPVIEAAVRRRRPSARDIVLLAVAAAGMTMLAADPSKAGPLLAWGPALVALASVFWAAQIVTVGHVAADADAATLATIQVAVVAAASWLWLGAAAAGAALWPDVVQTERAVAWSWDLGASVFFLGYVTCALAFAVQAWVQRRLSPTRTAILFSPEPVFAALAGRWFLDEQFGPQQFAGGALVLVAVALAVLPPRRRAEAPGAVA